MSIMRAWVVVPVMFKNTSLVPFRTSRRCTQVIWLLWLRPSPWRWCVFCGDWCAFAAETLSLDTKSPSTSHDSPGCFLLLDDDAVSRGDWCWHEYGVKCCVFAAETHSCSVKLQRQVRRSIFSAKLASKARIRLASTSDILRNLRTWTDLGVSILAMAASASKMSPTSLSISQ